MLDQIILKVRKQQSKSQMRLPLKNCCETSRCLVGDMWSNDKSDSVIILIVAAVPLTVNDHVVQNNVSTHDQPESVLRVRLTSDG
jgi:hypothetical protein